MDGKSPATTRGRHATRLFFGLVYAPAGTGHLANDVTVSVSPTVKMDTRRSRNRRDTETNSSAIKLISLSTPTSRSPDLLFMVKKAREPLMAAHPPGLFPLLDDPPREEASPFIIPLNVPLIGEEHCRGFPGGIALELLHGGLSGRAREIVSPPQP